MHEYRNSMSSSNREKYVKEFFEKKFEYKKPHSDGNRQEWELPPIDQLYENSYQFEELQILKQSLNDVKSKLNNYTAEQWSAHTKRKNPAGEITWRLKKDTKAEFVTVAWCKFFECLHQYPLVESPKLNSLHLCEAPGAFIAALNHYLHSIYNREQVTWIWRATTLNPYNEGNPLSNMIVDDRFMLDTLDNWLFYEDLTGNIISIKNIEEMQRNCSEIFPDGVHLITADGSLDCAEVPDCQEEYVSTLQFAEIVTALSILSKGGKFVVKMFTMFEASTVSVMYLLNCAFDNVQVFKPATSKHGNSEVYVICLGYKKDVSLLAETVEIMKSRLSMDNPDACPMFAKVHLPHDFLLQHKRCCNLFMSLQTNAIESNIHTFHRRNRSNIENTTKLREHIADAFFEKFKVKPLSEDLCIITDQNISTPRNTVIFKGSYADRETFKQLSSSEQIFRLRGDLNHLERGASLFKEDVLLENESVNCLQISKGAAITEVRSSLFASLPVMLFRSRLLNLIDSDPIWSLDPKCVIDEDETIIYDVESSSQFNEAQKAFFLKVLEALLSKELTPANVMFSGLPFLTHLSVSILRYLSSNVYQTLKISGAPHTITLENPQSGESRRHLNLLLETVRSNDEIHCVMKIPEMHRNRFAATLTKYNDSLLIEGFKRVLAE